jgi:hypothetical protein
MVEEFQRRLTELRFVEGIEKVEHVPYPSGDEFWVRFNRPLNLKELGDIARKHGAAMVKFGGLPSKLPRPLAEILWDGVNHVITKNARGWPKFTASLGFEPDGLAKIAKDAHGPFEIFIATQEEGVQILYEYLGMKYVAPAPPKSIAPPKPPVTPVAKPAPPAPSPSPKANVPQTAPQPTPQPPQATPAPAAQPAPVSAPAKGQYRPHAWGRPVTTTEQKSQPAKSDDETTQ